jgi:hypothetical protein
MIYNVIKTQRCKNENHYAAWYIFEQSKSINKAYREAERLNSCYRNAHKDTRCDDCLIEVQEANQ